MEQPLISIIVPVYNAEPYLDNCLDSIAAQTWGNLEVWLVDDGSTDASPALCDARAAADSRFHAPPGQRRGIRRPQCRPGAGHRAVPPVCGRGRLPALRRHRAAGTHRRGHRGRSGDRPLLACGRHP